MMKLWGWFSGKKTVIGGSALWLAWFLTDFVIGELEITSALVPKAAMLLEWVGGVLVPGGLIHKGVKAAPAPEA